jgi:hypothetical protein
MDIGTYVKRTLERLLGARYYIIRPSPAYDDGRLEVLEFKNKFELESWLKGCSDPSQCIPAMKLDIEYKVKMPRGNLK